MCQEANRPIKWKCFLRLMPGFLRSPHTYKTFALSAIFMPCGADLFPRKFWLLIEQQWRHSRHPWTCLNHNPYIFSVILAPVHICSTLPMSQKCIRWLTHRFEERRWWKPLVYFRSKRQRSVFFSNPSTINHKRIEISTNFDTCNDERVVIRVLFKSKSKARAPTPSFHRKKSPTSNFQSKFRVK